MTAEGCDERGQRHASNVERDGLSRRELIERRFGLIVQRVLRVAEHTIGYAAERRVELVHMQFADEELRDGFREVAMTVGAAGHAQRREWIGRRILIAERLQYTPERQFAARQGPAIPIDEGDGADRAMIEAQAAAACDGVRRIAGGARHPVEQSGEQQHVHRRCHLRARDARIVLASGGEHGRKHGGDPGAPVFAQDRRDQLYRRFIFDCHRTTPSQMEMPIMNHTIKRWNHTGTAAVYFICDNAKCDDPVAAIHRQPISAADKFSRPC